MRKTILATLAAALLGACTIGVTPTADQRVAVNGSIDALQAYRLYAEIKADRARAAASAASDKAARNVQPSAK